MVESNQNCHKCGKNMLYVKEIKKINGVDVEFTPFVYLAYNKTPQEIRYDEDLNKKKYFCEYCIPLVEKEYRGEKCGIWRIRYYKDKNIHTGQVCWMDSVSFIEMLSWQKENLGWYDEKDNRYNFYKVFRGNNCQTCNNSLDQPSDKSCCQESQEKISKDKSNNNDNSRERERETNPTITNWNPAIRTYN